MPAKSRAQQRLMGAAEHGAQFPMARKVASTMTKRQMHDFASGPMTGKPAHMGRQAALASHPNASRLGKFLHAKRVK